MAAQLTFDNCTIGAVDIATSAFVRGGNLSLDPNMAEVATADGALHQIPSYVGGSASCRIKGDYLSLNTPVGLGVAIVLKSGSSTVHSGTGLVTASYAENDNATSLEMKLDPVEDAE
jgi:hypothetical protein